MKHSLRRSDCKGGMPMPKFWITLDPAAARLYRAVARSGGRSVEQVLSDALFKLAGELSLEALAAQNGADSGGG